MDFQVSYVEFLHAWRARILTARECIAAPRPATHGFQATLRLRPDRRRDKCGLQYYDWGPHSVIPNDFERVRNRTPLIHSTYVNPVPLKTCLYIGNPVFKSINRKGINPPYVPLRLWHSLRRDKRRLAILWDFRRSAEVAKTTLSAAGGNKPRAATSIVCGRNRLNSPKSPFFQGGLKYALAMRGFLRAWPAGLPWSRKAPLRNDGLKEIPHPCPPP